MKKLSLSILGLAALLAMSAVGIGQNQNLPYQPQRSAGTSLVLQLGYGTALCKGTTVNYNGGSLTMAASSVNYVYLDGSNNCVPTVNQSSFPSPSWPIAVVTTTSNDISSIKDVRSFPAQVTTSSMPEPVIDAGGQVYNVKATYGTGIGGLVGDGVILQGCSITINTNSLTCPSANFTSADVGKSLGLSASYGTGLSTWTITSFVSATNVLISGNVATTYNGTADVEYGTNDLAALNNLISYISGLGGGTLFFPEGIYVLNGPPTAAGFVVDIPTTAANIQLEGPTNAMGIGLYSHTTVAGRATLCFLGGSLSPGNSLFGVESNGGGFSAVALTIKDLNFVVPYGLPVTALNFQYVSELRMSGFAIQPNRDANASPSIPTNTSNYSLILPATGNGGLVNLSNGTVALGYYAIEAYEHADIRNVQVMRSNTALDLPEGGSPHSVFLKNFQTLQCTTDILLGATNGGGSYPPPLYGSIDVEGGTTIAGQGTTPTGSGFLAMTFVTPTTGPTLTNISPNLQYMVLAANSTENAHAGMMFQNMSSPTVLYSAAGTPLPTCSSSNVGTSAKVSDATTPTFMGAYTSGGSDTSPVMCQYNGSTYQWVTY